MASESKGTDVTTAEELNAAAEDLSWPMRLANMRYRVKNADKVQLLEPLEETKAEMMALIEKHSMAPFYEATCAELGWKVDEALLKKLQEANVEEEKKLDATYEDAKVNHGEVEVLDAILAKAEFYGRIGSTDKAVELYLSKKEQKMSSGQKIDCLLKSIRLCLAAGDLTAAKTHIASCAELIEIGGDWDRRNRLKVYEGAYCMAARDFSRAADLLLDSVATFTAHEMFSYKSFIFYVVVVALQPLDRNTLRTKVVESPDVLSALLDLPHVSSLLTSFYECRYRDFLAALVEVEQHIQNDRLLAQHAQWYLREMRVNAYTQFLESYRSVTLSSMAASFGLTPAFLDAELSRFIAAGRINAKIDKIHDIVETTRPDVRTAQYHEVIHKGDALLNHIQQLARVVSA